MKKMSLICACVSLLSLNACGGSGGGDGAPAAGAGDVFLVEATVSRDSCGERLANVRQNFTFEENADGGTVINTSLVRIPVADLNGSLEGAFIEGAGDCTRQYAVKLTGIDAGAGLATLTSTTTCPASACETEWVGTITEQATSAIRSLDGRVRGENCNANVPTDVGYRASLFECNGAAAVLLRNGQRNNHSVVVRRDGEFNDRDPRNPSCGTNRCSPYKTQKRIELPEYQTNCLGDSGFSADYAPVNRISIKYTAKVTNANDTNQFEQYCLNSTQVNSN